MSPSRVDHRGTPQPMGLPRVFGAAPCSRAARRHRLSRPASRSARLGPRRATPHQDASSVASSRPRWPNHASTTRQHSDWRGCGSRVAWLLLFTRHRLAMSATTSSTASVRDGATCEPSGPAVLADVLAFSSSLAMPCIGATKPRKRLLRRSRSTSSPAPTASPDGHLVPQHATQHGRHGSRVRGEVAGRRVPLPRPVGDHRQDVIDRLGRNPVRDLLVHPLRARRIRRRQQHEPVPLSSTRSRSPTTNAGSSTNPSRPGRSATPGGCSTSSPAAATRAATPAPTGHPPHGYTR